MISSRVGSLPLTAIELIVGVVTVPEALTRANGNALTDIAEALMGSEKRRLTTAPSTPIPSTVGGTHSALTAVVAAEVTASGVPQPST